MKRKKKTSAKLGGKEKKLSGGSSDMFNQEIPKRIVNSRLKKKTSRKKRTKRK